MMYTPKKDLYKALKSLGYSTMQNQPEVFTTLPAITFFVGNNSLELDLDKKIAKQDIEVIVDIWAEKSSDASRILSEVENKLRQENYILEFSADVPNIGTVRHTTARFSNIK